MLYYKSWAFFCCGSLGLFFKVVLGYFLFFKGLVFYSICWVGRELDAAARQGMRIFERNYWPGGAEIFIQISGATYLG